MTIILILSIDAYGQYNVNQNQSIQVNNQQVNINVPVIEKEVYIDRYRTVYVDRPQPARVAKRLNAPICLHNYLWVYIEDIGDFKDIKDAIEMVQNINMSAPYDRIWRIPTPAELAVLEQNADVVGLGSGIYLATDHKNGILRMVSSGPTASELKAQEIAKQNAIYRQQLEERQRIARQKAQKEAEELRLAEEQRKKTEYGNNPILAVKELCGLDIMVIGTRSIDNIKKCSEGYHIATNQEIELIKSKLYKQYFKALTNITRSKRKNNVKIIMLTAESYVSNGRYIKTHQKPNHCYTYDIINCYDAYDFSQTIGKVSYCYDSKKDALNIGPSHVKTIADFITIYIKN